MTSEVQAIIDRVPAVEEIQRRLDANEAQRKALRKMLDVARAAEEARKCREEAASV